jgi:hypothetical protein
LEIRAIKFIFIDDCIDLTPHNRTPVSPIKDYLSKIDIGKSFGNFNCCSGMCYVNIEYHLRKQMLCINPPPGVKSIDQIDTFGACAIYSNNKHS